MTVLHSFSCVIVVLFHFVTTTIAQTDTIYYNLEDNTLESTFIGNVVSDGELQLLYTTSVLQQLSYVLLNKASYIHYFLIEENTGNIKTSQLVDRDTLCPKQNDCQLELDVAVQPNAYFRVIKVFLTVTDENDNAPKFKDASIKFDLPESTPLGVISPLIAATDLDSPQNGVKGYRLVNSFNKFQLKVKNNTDYSGLEVNLILIDMLDREDSDIYVLQVLAFDGGIPSRSGSLDITIQVHDVNDNHPQFEQKSYDIDVNETFPVGDSIIQVYARDIDAGDNGQVIYHFSTSNHKDINDTFILEKETGQIKLKRQLDFESQSFYSISVVAEDRGINSIPGNAKVLISVLDVNDVTPKIIINDLPSNGILHIMENLPQHAYLAHISIYDEEIGNNGKVDCVIDRNRFFILEKLYEKEYKIMTTQSLDREDTPEILVKIICKDYGVPVLRSEMDLTVVVDDENDNSPVFVSNINKVQIEEGNIPGSRVAKIEAIDNDLGLNGDVRYSCVHIFFNVDAVSGEVSTKREFDRERDDFFTVTVIARDLGSNPRYNTTVLSVMILDIDDNKPIFKSKFYHMNISENLPLLTYIGNVFAEDKDTDTYNQFYYFPVSLRTVRLFIINNKTGAIYSNYSFDRETETQYKFEIGVCPKGGKICQDFATVMVKILDENDNAPIISFPSEQSNHIVLSHKTPVGYKVTKVISYDLDIGNNSHLSFQLVQHKDQYFYIDNDTGNIYVNKALWSMNDANFTLQVLVSDFGIPRKTSVSTLYVTVNNSITPIAVRFSNMHNTDVVDLVAIVVGSLCGLLIAILLVLLFVLLLLRHRRKKEDTITNKDANTIVNKHFSVQRNDNTKTKIAEKKNSRQIECNFEEKKQKPFLDTQVDRDCDSGCFDLSLSDSHSSKDNSHKKRHATVNLNHITNADEGKIMSSIPANTSLTVIQTKCYHPPSNKHAVGTVPFPSVKVKGSSFGSYSSDLSFPCEKKEFSFQQKKLDQNVNSLPPDEQQHKSNHKSMPNLLPKFTNYLKNESQQLEEKGHVYHVKNPKFSVKKTVRFREPESSGNIINESLHQSHDNTIPDSSFNSNDIESKDAMDTNLNLKGSLYTGGGETEYISINTCPNLNSLV